MEIQLIPIADLKPAAYNPRTISTEEFQGLVQSLKTFGLVEPIVVNKDMTVIGGHMRMKAWAGLGNRDIPCHIVDLNKKQEKKLNVLLNSQAISGKYDDLKLSELLTELKLDDDYTSLRLDKLEPLDLSEQVAEAQEDDFEPPKEAKYQVQIGDVFQLGNHRLMCGDSTSIENVEKLMDGQKADMAHNDPPYGMKKENEGVLNDNLNYNDLLQFNREWISLQFTHLKDNGSWYCWGIDEPLMDIYSNILKPLIETQKATFRNLITWDKGHGQGQMSDGFRMYPIADEKCLFVMCGVQGFNNNADNYFEGWDSVVNYLDNEKNKANLTIKDCKRLAGHSEKSGCHWFDKSQWMMPTEETYNSWKLYCEKNNIDAFKKEYDELKKEYDELKKEYYSTRAYFDNAHDNQNNVWHFARTSSQEREGTGAHATPKPIALCERAIKSSCLENGLVVDYFGGSGSTLIACEQLNRKCYMMELDPYYCSVIIERWEKLTGLEHKKL